MVTIEISAQDEIAVINDGIRVYCDFAKVGRVLRLPGAKVIRAGKSYCVAECDFSSLEEMRDKWGGSIIETSLERYLSFNGKGVSVRLK